MLRHALPLVLLTLALAGCVATSQPAPTQAEGAAPGPAEPVWRALRAEYATTDGETLVLELLPGVHEVLARDRLPQQAHRLDVHRTDAFGTWSETYYLDADARIVRVDVPCMQAPDCLYAHVDWSTQGLPAPYGLWVLRGLPDDGVLRYTVHGREHAVEVRVHDGLVVVPPHESPVPLAAQLRGVYGQALGTPAPATIDQNDHHGQRRLWLLQEHEAGPPLPALEPRDLRTPALEPTPHGIPPGADAVPVEGGTTPREALDWLLDEGDPEAAEALADGCLHRMRVLSPRDSTDPLDPVRGIGSYQEIQFTIQGPQDLRRWTVQAALHDDGGRSFRLDGGPRDDGASVDCRAVPDRMGPGLGDLGAFVHRLPLSADRSDGFVTAELGKPLPRDWLEPLGTGFARFAFRPDWVPAEGSYVPYSLLVNLDTGWLFSLDLHPDDLAVLDA